MLSNNKSITFQVSFLPSPSSIILPSVLILNRVFSFAFLYKIVHYWLKEQNFSLNILNTIKAFIFLRIIGNTVCIGFQVTGSHPCSTSLWVCAVHGFSCHRKTASRQISVSLVMSRDTVCTEKEKQVFVPQSFLPDSSNNVLVAHISSTFTQDGEYTMSS